MCITKRTINIKINGLGLIRIPPGCKLQTTLTTLPGLEPISGTSLIVYEPNIHLDLTKLSIDSQQNSSVKSSSPTSRPAPQDQLYRERHKALDELEQQFHDFSLQRQEKANHSNLIHGSYAGIGILALLLLVYICHAKILIIVSTCWTCCHRKKSSTGHSTIAKCVSSTFEELKPTTTLTMSDTPESPEPSQNTSTSTNDSKESIYSVMKPMSTPRISIPKQTLQPA